MRSRDIIERVRSADPIDTRALEESVDRVARDELCERIMDQPYPASPTGTPWGRRQAGARTFLLPASIVVAAVVLSVAVWLTFGSKGDGPTRDTGLIAGTGGTSLPPTLTTGAGADPVPPERAQELSSSAWLAAQAAEAEAIVWGEVVAVEPPRVLTLDSDAAAGGTAEADAAVVYSTYSISPHEVWKGHVSLDVPTEFLTISGTARGASPRLGTPLPLGLHMGDQVVVLAESRPELGEGAAGRYWLIRGAQSVFLADGDGVFRRMEPVFDDPAGNAGPLSWLRGLLKDGR